MSIHLFDRTSDQRLEFGLEPVGITPLVNLVAADVKDLLYFASFAGSSTVFPEVRSARASTLGSPQIIFLY
jgi:hypothetical protein